MSARDFQSAFLPWCLTLGRDEYYSVTNSNSLPLGIATKGYRPSDRQMYVKFKSLTPEAVKRISFTGSSDVQKIYLYGVDCPPTASPAAMRDYLIRIAHLAALEVE